MVRGTSTVLLDIIYIIWRTAGMHTVCAATATVVGVRAGTDSGTCNCKAV